MNSICEAGVIKGGKVTGQWDGNNAKCQECGKTFSRFLISGRHHCRICGKSVCGRAECSTKRNVSNALLKRGNTNEVHQQRAESSSFRREWVCKTCVNTVLKESKNLLGRLGVFRLCVCSGAFEKTGNSGIYFPESKRDGLTKLDQAIEKKYEAKFGNDGCYRHFSDHAWRYVPTGTLPNLSADAAGNVGSGKKVDCYREQTVAGQAAKVLKKFRIEGVKVTAAKGIYRTPGDGRKTTIRTDIKPAALNRVSNYGFMQIYKISDYGGDTLVDFTDEKFYVMT